MHHHSRPGASTRSCASCHHLLLHHPLLLRRWAPAACLAWRWPAATITLCQLVSACVGTCQDTRQAGRGSGVPLLPVTASCACSSSRAMEEEGVCDTTTLYLNSMRLFPMDTGATNNTNNRKGAPMPPFACVAWNQERGLLTMLTHGRIAAGFSHHGNTAVGSSERLAPAPLTALPGRTVLTEHDTEHATEAPRAMHDQCMCMPRIRRAGGV